jgi:uncharacterized protein YodC (DUF2158 family)
MPDQIAPGSVVQLRSGSPNTTVRFVEDSYGTMQAACDWFVADRALWKKDSDMFPLTSLKIAPE